MAISRGLCPTSIGWPIGSPVLRSRRVTVSSSEFATQADLKPSLMPRGPLPTGIGSPLIFAVEGSMRETVLPPVLATHTVDLPTKTPVGDVPTPIGGAGLGGGARGGPAAPLVRGGGGPTR